MSAYRQCGHLAAFLAIQFLDPSIVLLVLAGCALRMFVCVCVRHGTVWVFCLLQNTLLISHINDSVSCVPPSVQMYGMCSSSAFACRRVFVSC